MTIWFSAEEISRLEMLLKLQRVFRGYFQSRGRSDYGITVMEAARDLSVIDVGFRFLAGVSYCCAEPGCHLPKRCEELIALAREQGIELPAKLVVRWHCVVEEGARLQCLVGLGLPAESEGYAFEG